MTLEFIADKETKNTIRFAEVTQGEEEPKVGMIYVPKGTLAEIKWVDGDKIVIGLSAKH